MVPAGGLIYPHLETVPVAPQETEDVLFVEICKMVEWPARHGNAEGWPLRRFRAMLFVRVLFTPTPGWLTLASGWSNLMWSLQGYGIVMASLIGQTVFHYKILEKPGEGDKGVVCKAERFGLAVRYHCMKN